jgi:hypothetical protein
MNVLVGVENAIKIKIRKEIVSSRLSVVGKFLFIASCIIIFHACNCPSSTISSGYEGEEI